MAENDNEKITGETDKDPRLLYADEEQESGIFRWMSALVVLLAVAGFFGLAWYAYKSGGEATDEKDVELVKADKSPVKETPANPGGMQIPNQDKTVYGLISGNKTERPTVERILPAPEEPIARGNDTETWMSDKAKNKITGTQDSAANTAATTEVASADVKKTEQFNPLQAQVIQTEPKTPPAETKSVASVPAVTPLVPAETTAPKSIVTIPSNPASSQDVKKETVAPKAAVPVADSEEEDASEKEDAPAPKAEPAVKLPAKGARAQLGAYKSESEAKSNWAKLSKQFATEIGSKEHYIIRADLGEKGVYYRLQVAPFASAKEAEQFCLTFVSAGQNCFLAKAK